MTITLRQLREQNNLTQEEFAGAMGLHVQRVCNIEKGHVQLPPKYFKKAAKILKTDVNHFIQMALEKHTENIYRKMK